MFQFTVMEQLMSMSMIEMDGKYILTKTTQNNGRFRINKNSR